MARAPAQSLSSWLIEQQVEGLLCCDTSNFYQRELATAGIWNHSRPQTDVGKLLNEWMVEATFEGASVPGAIGAYYDSMVPGALPQAQAERRIPL